MITEQELQKGEFSCFPPELESSTPAIPEARPRIWSVFVACLTALVAMTTASAIAGMVFVLLTNPQADFLQALNTPVAFLFVGSATQLAIAGTALLFAFLSREPMRRRLGLVKPGLPLWAYLIFAVGSLVPMAIGLLLGVGLSQFTAPDPTVAELYAHMNWGIAIPFILFIALAPGFAEELLYRGYIQRRLLQRWSPPVAIMVTSVLFALMHIDPIQIVFTLPLGIWLGVLAWRTGSVWPGIVCHAFINGLWNIVQIFSRLMDWPEPAIVVSVILAVVVLACFAMSVLLLRRQVTTRTDSLVLLPKSAAQECVAIPS